MRYISSGQDARTTRVQNPKASLGNNEAPN